jgi:hypothetical protein
MSSENLALQNLSDQLKKLEGENRWIKRIGLASFILAACVFFMGQAPPPRTLEAESFVLRDAAGRMRASLKMLSDEPSLTLYDADGGRRIELQKSADQAGLLFLDDRGKVRAALGMIGDRPRLTLSDNGGAERVIFGVEPSGSRLALFDANGNTIWWAPSNAADPSGAPAENKPRVSLELWSSGGPFKDEQNTGPLDREMELLAKTCPQVAVTIDTRNSDYVLRLTHHSPGGSFLRPSKPPPDYDRDFYRWSVIAQGGDIVETGANESLTEAIRHACDVVVKNRMRN